MERFSITCAAVIPILGLWAAPALAHGTSSGSSSGGLALLIFPAAAIIFGLFLVFSHHRKGWNVLVIGGNSEVGSEIVSKLLDRKHRVTSYDQDVGETDHLAKFQGFMNFFKAEGKPDDEGFFDSARNKADAIIFLSEPSDANEIRNLIEQSKHAGIKRFLALSTLDVFDGNRDEIINEDTGPQPLSERARLYAVFENALIDATAPGFSPCVIRVGHVLGTSAAPSSVENEQNRPALHINDLTDLLILVLAQPDAKISGKCFHASAESSRYPSTRLKEALSFAPQHSMPDR